MRSVEWKCTWKQSDHISNNFRKSEKSMLLFTWRPVWARQNLSLSWRQFKVTVPCLPPVGCNLDLNYIHYYILVRTITKNISIQWGLQDNKQEETSKVSNSPYGNKPIGLVAALTSISKSWHAPFAPQMTVGIWSHSTPLNNSLSCSHLCSSHTPVPMCDSRHWEEKNKEDM